MIEKQPIHCFLTGAEADPEVVAHLVNRKSSVLKSFEGTLSGVSLREQKLAQMEPGPAKMLGDFWGTDFSDLVLAEKLIPRLDGSNLLVPDSTSTVRGRVYELDNLRQLGTIGYWYIEPFWRQRVGVKVLSGDGKEVKATAWMVDGQGLPEVKDMEKYNLFPYGKEKVLLAADIDRLEYSRFVGKKPIIPLLARRLATLGLTEDLYWTLPRIDDLRAQEGAEIIFEAEVAMAKEIRKKARQYCQLAGKSNDPEWQDHMLEKAAKEAAKAEELEAYIDKRRKIVFSDGPSS